MKTKAERYYADIPATRTPDTVLDRHDDGTPMVRVEVSHAAGGINYFNYKTERRGFYLHVTPVSVREGSTSFTIGGATSGLKYFIEATARFNAKRLRVLGYELTSKAAVIALAFEQGDHNTIRGLIDKAVTAKPVIGIVKRSELTASLDLRPESYLKGGA
jgi:hypothetical protein